VVAAADRQSALKRHCRTVVAPAEAGAQVWRHAWTYQLGSRASRFALTRDDAVASNRGEAPPLALGQPRGLLGQPTRWEPKRVGRSVDSPRAIPTRSARGAPRRWLAPLLLYRRFGACLGRRGSRLGVRSHLRRDGLALR